MADEAEERRDLTAEELIEHVRGMKVGDLLVSTLATLSQLGYVKLERPTRDLAEARLAIESLRALLPVLKETAPEQTVRDFQQVVANLQLAFAQVAADQEKPEEDVPPEAPRAEEAPEAVDIPEDRTE